MISKELDIDGKILSISTGHVARQADGAVIVRFGDTMVLATAVSGKEPREGADFFPLMVDYRESAYSAGKIPGGFFKREGRPTEREILASRLIDRPIRPLFPDRYYYETILTLRVISSDQQNFADVLGGIAASAALSISGAPFNGPTASSRVGKLDGQLIINPTITQIENSEFDIMVAGTKESITMVEGELNETSEEDLLAAISFAHGYIQKIIALQEELVAAVGPTTREFESSSTDAALRDAVVEHAKDKVAEADRIQDKAERSSRISEIKAEAIEHFAEQFPESETDIKQVIAELQYTDVRGMILSDKKRLDGRGLTDIRDISCVIEMLPRAHGSALFTRGQTQALVTTTLGTKYDEQILDSIEEDETKRFMLHYNFPPFSVGEARPVRAPSRREIGHGNLAERALKRMLPQEEEFPYTVRIVSEILESNGSSSMATVCGGSLSLMDAGVPIKSAVAGIAMGLIKEGDKHAVLSDILGDEDHLGDMDFKVAGTEKGITSVQMDIKIQGISSEIMQEALTQAKEGRLHILGIMNSAISASKTEISQYAPKIISMKIDQDKIGAVIGPGGRIIREIIEKSGAKIDIEDDGTVRIASADAESSNIAIAEIKSLTADAEVGKKYTGKITKITNFGAFVEIMPGKEGLLHISEIDLKRVNSVEDYFKVGDAVEVLLRKVTKDNGKTKYELSRKALLKQEKPATEEPS